VQLAWFCISGWQRLCAVWEFRVHAPAKGMGALQRCNNSTNSAAANECYRLAFAGQMPVWIWTAIVLAGGVVMYTTLAYHCICSWVRCETSIFSRKVVKASGSQ
jgi:hypothetical protein